MAEFLVIYKDGIDPVQVDHVSAADIATAQTVVTAALAHGLGVNNGVKPQILVGIVALGAAFTVTPT